MTRRETRHLARCRVCRDAGPHIADALRSLPQPDLSVAERERLWQAIAAAHEARRRWSLRALLASLRGLARRRPTLVWTPAAAVALLLIVAPLEIGREQRLLSQATLNAQTVVERVEVADASSVLLLETPTSRVQVIWVVEPGDTPGESR